MNLISMEGADVEAELLLVFLGFWILLAECWDKRET